MPRRYRLTRAEFGRVLKMRFQRVVGRFITIHMYPMPGAMKGPKFGFVVPKKIVSRAVDRNRIERQMREVLCERAKTIPENLILVIHIKKGVLAASFAELSAEIHRLLERMYMQDTMSA